jgi:hypothetical protein
MFSIIENGIRLTGMPASQAAVLERGRHGPNGNDRRVKAAPVPGALMALVFV